MSVISSPLLVAVKSSLQRRLTGFKAQRQQGNLYQTDLDLEALILAWRAVQYVWQRYRCTPLWQSPNMHRPVLASSTETRKERTKCLINMPSMFK